MKKYILLITSLLLFVMFFIYGWFFDRLFNEIFMFALLPIPFIFIGFIICLVFAIITVFQKNRIDILTIIILLLIPLMLFTFPFRMAKVKFELLYYNKERNEIIELVQNKKLESDGIGNAELPNEYKLLSSSGEITIYQNDRNGTVIGFWVYRGMLSGSTQLIYSSKDVELVKANEGGHPIASIEKLKKHWFYVKTDY